MDIKIEHTETFILTLDGGSFGLSFVDAVKLYDALGVAIDKRRNPDVSKPA